MKKRLRCTLMHAFVCTKTDANNANKLHVCRQCVTTSDFLCFVYMGNVLIRLEHPACRHPRKSFFF